VREPGRVRGRISRRGLTLLIAGIGVVVSATVAARLPVPYVIESPGPTLNTLGRTTSGPLIQISGHPVSKTSGHLNMVTVSLQGGPGKQFNVFMALRAWLTPHTAVVPEQEVFIPGQSVQQDVQQDTEEMANSQQTATVAALCVLGIHFTTLDTIEATEKSLPAAGVLRRGDVITAVDGKAVGCNASAADLIRARRPGAPVDLTIRRGGKTQPFRLKTADVQGEPVVGVQVEESYRFPFAIKFDLQNIGGPSAGLMFALVHRRHRRDLGRRHGLPDRRNTAENGGRAERGRHGLPVPGGQLLRRAGCLAGRDAPGQGEHAARCPAGPGGAESGAGHAVVLRCAAGGGHGRGTGCGGSA
jgi:PDZ domain-containing protein